jgi:hypothetical protein
VLFLEIFVLSLLGYEGQSICFNIKQNETKFFVFVRKGKDLQFSLLTKARTSLTINMYFASLKYTSPTFVASMNNTVPSMTFIIAIILRWGLQNLNNRRPEIISILILTRRVLPFHVGWRLSI